MIELKLRDAIKFKQLTKEELEFEQESRELLQIVMQNREKKFEHFLQEEIINLLMKRDKSNIHFAQKIIYQNALAVHHHVYDNRREIFYKGNHIATYTHDIMKSEPQIEIFQDVIDNLTI